MKRKQAKSVKEALSFGVARAVVLFGVFVGVFFGQQAIANALQDSTPTVSPQPTPSQVILDENDCWTGVAPEDVTIPGHVVTQHGLGGRRMVDKALKQIFEGQQHNLTVYGFCR